MVVAESPSQHMLRLFGLTRKKKKRLICIIKSMKFYVCDISRVNNSVL